MEQKAKPEHDPRTWGHEAHRDTTHAHSTRPARNIEADRWIEYGGPKRRYEYKIGTKKFHLTPKSLTVYKKLSTPLSFILTTGAMINRLIVQQHSLSQASL